MTHNSMWNNILLMSQLRLDTEDSIIYHLSLSPTSSVWAGRRQNNILFGDFVAKQATKPTQQQQSKLCRNSISPTAPPWQHRTPTHPGTCLFPAHLASHQGPIQEDHQPLPPAPAGPAAMIPTSQNHARARSMNSANC